MTGLPGSGKTRAATALRNFFLQNDKEAIIVSEGDAGWYIHILMSPPPPWGGTVPVEIGISGGGGYKEKEKERRIIKRK